jgi:quinol monooxygenase YgiN
VAAPAFRVVLRMRVLPGRQARFEEVIGRIAARVAANPGNTGQAVFRDSADDATYHVVSDWVDGEAFWAHERDTGHRTDIAELGTVRAESSMSTMTPLPAWAGAPDATVATP